MTKSSKKIIQAAIWLGSIVLVIGIGLYYIPREYDSPGFWESLYSTLRLFVFERDLPTFPESRPLIFIYFAAPLITLSALGTAITYLFRMSPAIKTRWMSNHVIICGVGRTGKLLSKTLKDRGVNVIGVDLGPPDEFEEWCENNKFPMIYGDFHSKQALQKTNASSARSIIFSSGDDLANLEGALCAYELLQTEKGPVKLIWAHIANENLANTARTAIRTRGRVGIRFFDTYRIAATRMIEKHFNRDSRRGVGEVSILGFGKFGRDLLDVLAEDLDQNEKFDIRVLDKQDRSSEVKHLAEELGVADRVTFERAAIETLELVDETDKAFFLCTDDDLGNLTAAMALASKVDATHIYVRMAKWPMSAVADHFGEERGVVFVNINELVVHGIGNLPGVFEPAAEDDLKRADICG